MKIYISGPISGRPEDPGSVAVMSAQLQDAHVLAADLAAELPPRTLAEATLETSIEVER